MPSGETEPLFTAVFRARTKDARERAGLTQENVATVLGVELDTYKKWENRPTSSIPREKLLAFCLLTRVTCEQMLRAPTPQELAGIHPAKRPARRKPAPPRRKHA